jgi:hypothetical protein
MNSDSNLRYRLYRIDPPYAALEPLISPGLFPPAHLPRASVLGIEFPGPAPEDRDAGALVRELRKRFHAASLIMIAPGEGADPGLLRLAFRAERLRLRAVLPKGSVPLAVLRPTITAPADLGSDVVEWLLLRGAPLSPHLQHLVRELLTIPVHDGTVTGVLRRIGASESGTRSRFQKKHLPSPRAWCGLARGLRTALRIQGAPDLALKGIAGSLGYRDHTALSKQVRLTFRIQPSEIRGTLGWEWLLDRWWNLRASEVRCAHTAEFAP